MFLLTSTSPARIALLRQVGFRENEHFATVNAPVNLPFSGSDLDAICKDVIEAARVKIRFAVESALMLEVKGLPRRESIVVGTDTVAYFEGEVLDRPMSVDPSAASARQLADGEIKAREILARERGNHIQFITGLVIAQGDCLANDKATFVVSEATMKMYDNNVINEYVATSEPLNKAGAIGIQARGVCLFDSIKGSYSNIVGLPLAEFGQILRDPLFAGRVQLPFGLPEPVADSSSSFADQELEIVSAGDINYDIVFDGLPPGFFGGLGRPPGLHFLGTLKRAAGGTAVTFARGA
jgi:septum formation protein